MSEYKVGCIADLISFNKNRKLINDKNNDVDKKKVNSNLKFKVDENKNKSLINKTRKRNLSETETPVNNKKKIKKDDVIEKENSFENQKENKNVPQIRNEQISNSNYTGKKQKSKYKLELSDIVSMTKNFHLKHKFCNTKKKHTKNLKKSSYIKKLENNCVEVKNSSEKLEKTSKVKQKSKKKPEKKLYTDFTENTIFIGNLPLNYDKHKVCKVFSKFGEIDSARIRCVPIANINMKKKVASIKKEFNPNRNSLAAYVKYKSNSSVIKALNSNGMILDQHHIRVDLAESNKEKDMNKAVFVGGLPFDIEDDDLWEFFKNCGKINSVRIIRDSHTSMGKGFGYVNFDSTSSVELALQMNGQELKKRMINIKRCTNRIKKNKLIFNKSKSAEITNQLLLKKNKAKNKKVQMKKSKTSENDFQGRKANERKKRKKKPSKEVLQKRKNSKILQSS